MIIKLILICVILILTILVFIFNFKYQILKNNQNKLNKYFYNYLNTITSARYGNLKVQTPEGFDNFTNQLSKNTNALLESVYDRDIMINEHLEREKESQNLKQDFISSLAHDFKVPIIAQDNTYDLLLDNKLGELTPNQRQAIENLKISNNDLKNLCLDLLDAHKLDTHQFELNLIQTNVNDLIQEVIEQNKCILTIKKKKINFKNNEIILADIDSFLIKRALNNLISNAIFYGKNSSDIDISLEKKSDSFEISVRDYGEGIKEDVTKLFKKYYTQAKKYSNIGIGLGLYIVSKIVKAHNGEIEAKNMEDNSGACFTIKIPI